jgi:hypothetical protein
LFVSRSIEDPFIFVRLHPIVSNMHRVVAGVAKLLGKPG